MRCIGLRKVGHFNLQSTLPYFFASIRLTLLGRSVYYALQFHHGGIAQLVEQRIENPRVPSSTLGSATTLNL